MLLDIKETYGALISQIEADMWLIKAPFDEEEDLLSIEDECAGCKEAKEGWWA